MYQQRKKRIRRTDKLLLLSKLQTKLKTFTSSHHLLHSDKITYFYNSNGSNSKQDSFLSAGHFLSGIRWTSPHCDGRVSSSDISHWDRTRSSLSKMSHRKMAQPKLCAMHSTYGTMPLVLCSFALLGIGMAMINPSASNSSVYADSASVQSTNDGMSVSLTMDNPDVDTLVNQSKLGQVNYISTGFNVSTSNVDEYSIYVQTAPGYSNKLTNGNLTIDFVKSADTPTSSFGDNEWGYAVSESGGNPEGLKYSPVPDTGAIINPAYSTKDTTSDKSFTLNFAAKFGSNATPGHYTSSVILSVAAGAKDITTLPTWTIANMQDMNSTICANAEINTTGRLTDLRDGKQYWVSKLADGNCWMTQNLDYDDPDSIKVTSINEWTYITSDTTSPNTYRAYYDPGEKIVGNSGLIDASNGIDKHLLVGNYYSFESATNGTGSSLSSYDNTTDSICPKNWKLPTSQGYSTLMLSYEATQAAASAQEFNSSPLYFQYSGNVLGGNLQAIGNLGTYWAGTAVNNAIDAYIFNVNATSGVQLTGWRRNVGRSIRCVATAFTEAQTLETATYMQEVTAKTCERSTMEKQVQLTDYRDGKKYWVAKLKDGNCWMTQNLDFDIPDSLDATTSDVSGVVETNTIKVDAPSNWPANNDNPNYNGYYAPGDYIYNGPSDPVHGQGTSCSANNSSADALSTCSQFAKATVDNTSTQVLNDTNRHYHVGNYYSFSAATVKSGDSLTNRGDQATDSICPRNWQLPTSGTNASNVLLADGKTFAKLFEAYGWKWNQGYYTNTLNGGTSYYIYNAPFYFTYGGHLASSTLDSAGYIGYYWSSTVDSSTRAFSLAFYSGVLPANDSSRYGGFSVRCVVR